MSDELVAFLNFGFEKQLTQTKVVDESNVTAVERWQLNWRAYQRILTDLGVKADADSRPSLIMYSHPQPNSKVIDELLDFHSKLKSSMTEFVKEKKLPASAVRQFAKDAENVLTEIVIPEDLREDLTPQNTSSYALEVNYHCQTYKSLISAVIRRMILDSSIFGLEQRADGQFFMKPKVSEVFRFSPENRPDAAGAPPQVQKDEFAGDSLADSLADVGDVFASSKDFMAFASTLSSGGASDVLAQDRSQAFVESLLSYSSRGEAEKLRTLTAISDFLTKIEGFDSGKPETREGTAATLGGVSSSKASSFAAPELEKGSNLDNGRAETEAAARTAGAKMVVSQSEASLKALAEEEFQNEPKAVPPEEPSVLEPEVQKILEDDDISEKERKIGVIDDLEDFVERREEKEPPRQVEEKGSSARHNLSQKPSSVSEAPEERREEGSFDGENESAPEMVVQEILDEMTAIEASRNQKPTGSARRRSKKRLKGISIFPQPESVEQIGPETPLGSAQNGTDNMRKTGLAEFAAKIQDEYHSPASSSETRKKKMDSQPAVDESSTLAKDSSSFAASAATSTREAAKSSTADLASPMAGGSPAGDAAEDKVIIEAVLLPPKVIIEPVMPPQTAEPDDSNAEEEALLLESSMIEVESSTPDEVSKVAEGVVGEKLRSAYSSEPLTEEENIDHSLVNELDLSSLSLDRLEGEEELEEAGSIEASTRRTTLDQIADKTASAEDGQLKLTANSSAIGSKSGKKKEKNAPEESFSEMTADSWAENELIDLVDLVDDDEYVEMKGREKIVILPGLGQPPQTSSLVAQSSRDSDETWASFGNVTDQAPESIGSGFVVPEDSPLFFGRESSMTAEMSALLDSVMADSRADRFPGGGEEENDDAFLTAAEIVETDSPFSPSAAGSRIGAETAAGSAESPIEAFESASFAERKEFPSTVAEETARAVPLISASIDAEAPGEEKTSESFKSEASALTKASDRPVPRWGVSVMAAEPSPPSASSTETTAIPPTAASEKPVPRWGFRVAAAELSPPSGSATTEASSLEKESAFPAPSEKEDSRLDSAAPEATAIPPTEAYEKPVPRWGFRVAAAEPSPPSASAATEASSLEKESSFAIPSDIIDSRYDSAATEEATDIPPTAVSEEPDSGIGHSLTAAESPQPIAASAADAKPFTSEEPQTFAEMTDFDSVSTVAPEILPAAGEGPAPLMGFSSAADDPQQDAADSASEAKSSPQEESSWPTISSEMAASRFDSAVTEATANSPTEPSDVPESLLGASSLAA
ncbi:MAG: hypothetical protein LBJ64_11205, partial [Deltaproteobacteria bacterium]|nr:hypothetical protein [Deltaproteobacteria bacterium]